MTTAFLSHSDCGRHDTGWGHPEHVGRLRAIPKALREDPDLFRALHHAEGRHATEDEIALAHDRGYIATVRDLALAGGGQLDADTVESEGSWDAATAGAGCLLDYLSTLFAFQSYGSLRYGPYRRSSEAYQDTSLIGRDAACSFFASKAG